MLRFSRLIKNEFVKLFAKPSTFILMALIPIIAFGYGFIMKKAYDSYNQYSPPPESNMQNRIDELNSQVSGEVIDGNYAKYMGVTEGGFNPEHSLLELEILQYARSNDIDPTGWQLEALYETINLKMSEDENKIALSDKIYKAIEKNDIAEYLNISMDIIDDNLKNAQAEEKQSWEMDKYILELRIEKQIAPESQRFSYSENKDWKNTTLSEIYSQKQQLVTGQSYDGGPLTEKGRESLENELEVNVHRIKTDNAPPKGKSMIGFLFNSSSLVAVISLFIIIIAATMMATEYTTGTIKLLLISPFKRWKLFAAKLTTVFLMAVLLLAILFISSILAGGVMFGFGGAGSFLTYNGKIHETPIILAAILKYLLVCPELLVMTSLAIALAVIMRRSSVAIGVGVAMLFGGSMISEILMYLPYDFKRFFLFLNTNLSVYFPQLNISSEMMMEPRIPAEGMTFIFSIIVLAVYFICFTYTALDSFNRRDIKQA